MSFWFKDGDGFHATGFAAMLALLADQLPAALPRRYGSSEPLQGRIVEDDMTPLIRAFADGPDMLLKAAAPFGDVLMSIPCKARFARWHPTHFVKRRHLLGYVSFEIRPAIFADKQAHAALMAAFDALCLQLDVIYAEIRQDSDRPGGRGRFWEGLPHGPAHTRCIGPDYCGVWPDAVAQARRIGPNHVVWTKGQDAAALPSPPREMVLPLLDGGDPRGPPKLAQVFPFDYESGPDRYHW